MSTYQVTLGIALPLVLGGDQGVWVSWSTYVQADSQPAAILDARVQAVQAYPNMVGSWLRGIDPRDE